MRIDDGNAQFLATIVTNHVKEGAKPWDAGVVRILSHSNMNGDKIIVVTRSLPLFEYKIDPFEAFRLGPEELALQIAEAAFKFYRYRPALPVDDHIVLGEN